MAFWLSRLTNQETYNTNNGDGVGFKFFSDGSERLNNMISNGRRRKVQLLGDIFVFQPLFTAKCVNKFLLRGKILDCLIKQLLRFFYNKRVIGFSIYTVLL